MEKRLARSQRETADEATQAEAARAERDDLRSRLAEAETARDRATDVRKIPCVKCESARDAMQCTLALFILISISCAAYYNIHSSWTAAKPPLGIRTVQLLQFGHDQRQAGARQRH